MTSGVWRLASGIPTGQPWDAGRAVCQRLRRDGFEAWLVGGCVRDLLLGRPVHDVDVATSAAPEEVESRFAKTIMVGRAFGVTIVIDGDQRIEVATFRADGVYIDGRRPVGVVFTDAAGDVARRDFTINALLLDPEEGVVVDHVGGRADLEARCLRVVGDPLARLQEDRLRVLRGLRFAAGLGLTWDPASWSAAQATPLTGLSGERILQELDKGLACADPVRWLRDLAASGHLEGVLPCADVERGAARVATADLGPDGRLMAAAAGADLTAWSERMPLSRERRQRLRWLQAAEATLLTALVADRRRMLRQADAGDLVRLVGGPALAWWAAEPDHLDPLLSPKDLLQLGIAPGPAVGRLLRLVEDAQLEGRVTDRAAALALVQTAR